MPDFSTVVIEHESTEVEKRIERKAVPDLAGGYEADARAEMKEYVKKITPIIAEPRCAVCQHKDRAYLEYMIAHGVAYSAIANRVESSIEGSLDSFRRSLSNHAKKHMALDDAVTRAILEEEAALIGQNYEDSVRGAITHRGMLEVLARKAYSDVINGVSTVEPKDMIQMVKLLREMESDTANTSVETYKVQVAIFEEAIKNVCAELPNGQEILQMLVDEIRHLRTKEEFNDTIEEGFRRVGIPEYVDAQVIDE